MKEEKERTISCLKEEIKEVETSKQDFEKQLQQQRDGISKITVWLNTEINAGNN